MTKASAFIGTIVGLALIPAAVRAQTVIVEQTFDAFGACGNTCGDPCPLPGASGWVNDTAGDTMDWTVLGGATPSPGTGPSADHTSGTGRYLYTEASGTCSAADVADLEWRDVDLSAAISPFLQLWFHMYGADMGTLAVDVDPDGTAGPMGYASALAAFTDDQDLWQRTPRVDLSAHAGRVISIRFRGITGPGFESDMAIDDVAVYERLADDVGVASIDTPVDGCGLGASEAITVTLRNFGAAPQTGFGVELTVDSEAPIVETYTGTLAAASTAAFTFAATADLSAPGPHTITVRTILAGDELPANDSAARMVDTFPFGVISSFPTRETFEAGPGQWRVTGTSSFELGTPAPGAFSGASAWATNLSGDYGPDEDGAVESRCGYDLSGLTDPHVRLMIYRDGIEFSWDGARLEASTNGGASWVEVGTNISGGVGWYNDGEIDALPPPMDGWTGDGGAWETAAHPLTGLAGRSEVLLRVRFASDSLIHGPGLYLDDVEVFDNTNGLHVTNGPVAEPFAAIDADATRVVVQHIELSALGRRGSTVDGLTLTQSGTIPDAEIVAVELWQDDGDGAFDPDADTRLAGGVLGGGTVTLTPSPALTIPLLTRTSLFVTVDLAASVTPRATIAFGVAAPADVSVSTTPPVLFGATPIAGPTLTVFGPATIPFVDDLEGNRGNRTADAAATGTYPTVATTGGTIVPSAPTANDAVVGYARQVAASDGSGGTIPIRPNGGRSMAAISFDRGSAIGAVDYHFDMSGLTVADNLVWLQLAWNNANEEDHDADAVFVSVDGGSSWVAAPLRFDFTSPVAPGWAMETIDLSAALAAASAELSSDVIVRVQAGGDAALGDDGLLIDDVFVGQPQWIGLERTPAMVAVTAGGTDDVTARPVGEASQLTYEITNLGDLPLALSDASWTSSGPSNVSGVAVTQPADLTLDPGESTTFTVDFTVDAEAPFSFDVSFGGDDPRLAGADFGFTVSGVGVVPVLDVQRPAGTSITLGGVDDVGAVAAGVARSLDYRVENVGGVTLSWGGAAPVSIGATSNVTATVTAQPAGASLDAGAADAFAIEYTPASPGPFSFEVSVMAEGVMAFAYTVSGTADEMGGDGGVPGDGSVGPDGGTGGDDGCGCRAAGLGGRPRGGWALGLVWLALALRRRRRPR